MFFSWQGLFKEWMRIEERTHQWREDAVRGWRELQSNAAPLADRSFAEVESLRLRYRMDRIDQKRESRRIELLSEEKKRLIDQISEMEVFLSNPQRRSQREEN
jgi:hypothetical protein